MMIRNVYDLLRILLKQESKSQVKRQKSKLLIYDIYLKKYVNAEDLLVPSPTKDSIQLLDSWNKSKDFILFDFLLKKFINPKLDLLNPPAANTKSKVWLCNTIQGCRHASTIKEFWDKRPGNSTGDVPALPSTTVGDKSYGWAGQVLNSPQSNPKPEYSTSSKPGSQVKKVSIRELKGGSTEKKEDLTKHYKSAAKNNVTLHDGEYKKKKKSLLAKSLKFQKEVKSRNKFKGRLFSRKSNVKNDILENNTHDLPKTQEENKVLSTDIVEIGPNTKEKGYLLKKIYSQMFLFRKSRRTEGRKNLSIKSTTETNMHKDEKIIPPANSSHGEGSGDKNILFSESTKDSKDHQQLLQNTSGKTTKINLIENKLDEKSLGVDKTISQNVKAHQKKNSLGRNIISKNENKPSSNNKYNSNTVTIDDRHKFLSKSSPINKTFVKKENLTHTLSNYKPKKHNINNLKNENGANKSTSSQEKTANSENQYPAFSHSITNNETSIASNNTLENKLKASIKTPSLTSKSDISHFKNIEKYFGKSVKENYKISHMLNISKNENHTDNYKIFGLGKKEKATCQDVTGDKYEEKRVKNLKILQSITDSGNEKDVNLKNSEVSVEKCVDKNGDRVNQEENNFKSTLEQPGKSVEDNSKILQSVIESENKIVVAINDTTEVNLNKMDDKDIAKMIFQEDLSFKSSENTKENMEKSIEGNYKISQTITGSGIKKGNVCDNTSENIKETEKRGDKDINKTIKEVKSFKNGENLEGKLEKCDKDINLRILQTMSDCVTNDKISEVNIEKTVDKEIDKAASKVLSFKTTGNVEFKPYATGPVHKNIPEKPLEEGNKKLTGAIHDVTGFKSSEDPKTKSEDYVKKIAKVPEVLTYSNKKGFVHNGSLEKSDKEIAKSIIKLEDLKNIDFVSKTATNFNNKNAQETEVIQDAKEGFNHELCKKTENELNSLTDNKNDTLQNHMKTTVYIPKIQTTKSKGLLCQSTDRETVNDEESFTTKIKVDDTSQLEENKSSGQSVKVTEDKNQPDKNNFLEKMSANIVSHSTKFEQETSQNIARNNIPRERFENDSLNKEILQGLAEMNKSKKMTLVSSIPKLNARKIDKTNKSREESNDKIYKKVETSNLLEKSNKDKVKSNNDGIDPKYTDRLHAISAQGKQLEDLALDGDLNKFNVNNYRGFKIAKVNSDTQLNNQNSQVKSGLKRGLERNTSQYPRNKERTLDSSNALRKPSQFEIRQKLHGSKNQVKNPIRPKQLFHEFKKQDMKKNVTQHMSNSGGLLKNINKLKFTDRTSISSVSGEPINSKLQESKNQVLNKGLPQKSTLLKEKESPEKDNILSKAIEKSNFLNKSVESKSDNIHGTNNLETNNSISFPSKKVLGETNKDIKSIQRPTSNETKNKFKNDITLKNNIEAETVNVQKESSKPPQSNKEQEALVSSPNIFQQNTSKIKTLKESDEDENTEKPPSLSLKQRTKKIHLIENNIDNKMRYKNSRRKLIKPIKIFKYSGKKTLKPKVDETKNINNENRKENFVSKLKYDDKKTRASNKKPKVFDKTLETVTQLHNHQRSKSLANFSEEKPDKEKRLRKSKSVDSIKKLNLDKYLRSLRKSALRKKSRIKRTQSESASNNKLTGKRSSISENTRDYDEKTEVLTSEKKVDYINIKNKSRTYSQRSRKKTVIVRTSRGDMETRSSPGLPNEVEDNKYTMELVPDGSSIKKKNIPKLKHSKIHLYFEQQNKKPFESSGRSNSETGKGKNVSSKLGTKETGTDEDIMGLKNHDKTKTISVKKKDGSTILIKRDIVKPKNDVKVQKTYEIKSLSDKMLSKEVLKNVRNNSGKLNKTEESKVVISTKQSPPKPSATQSNSKNQENKNKYLATNMDTETNTKDSRDISFSVGEINKDVDKTSIALESNLKKHVRIKGSNTNQENTQQIHNKFQNESEKLSRRTKDKTVILNLNSENYRKIGKSQQNLFESEKFNHIDEFHENHEHNGTEHAITVLDSTKLQNNKEKLIKVEDNKQRISSVQQPSTTQHFSKEQLIIKGNKIETTPFNTQEVEYSSIDPEKGEPSGSKALKNRLNNKRITMNNMTRNLNAQHKLVKNSDPAPSNTELPYQRFTNNSLAKATGNTNHLKSASDKESFNKVKNSSQISDKDKWRNRWSEIPSGTIDVVGRGMKLRNNYSNFKYKLNTFNTPEGKMGISLTKSQPKLNKETIESKNELMLNNNKYFTNTQLLKKLSLSKSQNEHEHDELTFKGKIPSMDSSKRPTTAPNINKYERNPPSLRKSKIRDSSQPTETESHNKNFKRNDIQSNIEVIKSESKGSKRAISKKEGEMNNVNKTTLPYHNISPDHKRKLSYLTKSALSAKCAIKETNLDFNTQSQKFRQNKPVGFKNDAFQGSEVKNNYDPKVTHKIKEREQELTILATKKDESKKNQNPTGIDESLSKAKTRTMEPLELMKSDFEFSRKKQSLNKENGKVLTDILKGEKKFNSNAKPKDNNGYQQEEWNPKSTTSITEDIASRDKITKFKRAKKFTDDSILAQLSKNACSQIKNKLVDSKIKFDNNNCSEHGDTLHSKVGKDLKQNDVNERLINNSDDRKLSSTRNDHKDLIGKSSNFPVMKKNKMQPPKRDTSNLNVD